MPSPARVEAEALSRPIDHCGDKVVRAYGIAKPFHPSRIVRERRLVAVLHSPQQHLAQMIHAVATKQRPKLRVAENLWSIPAHEYKPVRKIVVRRWIIRRCNAS